MQASWRQRWRHHIICPVPPFIWGTRKATNFKFGRYIHRVHASKSVLKICEKRERGRIQGRPKFFQYPLLSQEHVKLQISNLAGIFTGFIRAKGFQKFWRKGSVGVFRDCPIFFQYTLLSHQRVNLRTSNLAGIYKGSMRTKALENLGEKGALAYPGTSHFFKNTPYYFRNA